DLISGLVALLSLGVSVTLLNRELYLIGNRNRDGGGMPADPGSGPEVVPARRMTRGGLHALADLPLFFAAIPLPCLFNPATGCGTYERTPFFRRVMKPLADIPDPGALAIAGIVAFVLICGAVASLLFWARHRGDGRWPQAGWHPWAYSFAIGLSFGL